jgi:hypothetical protein
VLVEGIAFYGFPQSDTLKVVYNGIIDDSQTLPNFLSYKQWHWKLSDSQKNPWKGIQAVTSGLMSFHAKSEFAKDGKHSIFITYIFRKEYLGKEEIITFNGRKI